MANKINLPLLGGLVAGIATSACCAGPLILLTLGFGGAWVSNLTALEPYRPIFIVFALVALAVAYLRIFKAGPEQACENGKVCAQPSAQRIYKGLFLSITAIVLVSIASPYWIPFIYD